MSWHTYGIQREVNISPSCMRVLGIKSKSSDLLGKHPSLMSYLISSPVFLELSSAAWTHCYYNCYSCLEYIVNSTFIQWQTISHYGHNNDKHTFCLHPCFFFFFLHMSNNFLSNVFSWLKNLILILKQCYLYSPSCYLTCNCLSVVSGYSFLQ